MGEGVEGIIGRVSAILLSLVGGGGFPAIRKWLEVGFKMEVLDPRRCRHAKNDANTLVLEPLNDVEVC